MLLSEQNKDYTSKVFSLNFFKKEFAPDEITSFKLDQTLHNEKRLNHYLIKQPNDPIFYIDHLHKSLKDFITLCFLCVAENIPREFHNRYVYLTFDNMPVKSGQTQRDQGWHVDGLQGDEVPVKVDNCFQFICFDCLPTNFTKQPFNLDGFNLSKHNIFNALSKQVNPDKTYNIKENTIYFMNPYMVHKAIEANKSCNRLFVRLYFSHLPITSKKATINKNINYNFTYHTTSGNIPAHLK